jgi:hypothetical protein
MDESSPGLEQREYAQVLLRRAESDFRACQALAADTTMDDVVGFHAQQAVEKSRSCSRASRSLGRTTSTSSSRAPRATVWRSRPRSRRANGCRRGRRSFGTTRLRRGWIARTRSAWRTRPWPGRGRSNSERPSGSLRGLDYREAEWPRSRTSSTTRPSAARRHALARSWTRVRRGGSRRAARRRRRAHRHDGAGHGAISGPPRFG